MECKGLLCPNCKQHTRHVDGVHEFCTAGCTIRNEPGDLGDTIVVTTLDDSNYIKQSVRDENFSKRADDAGRLYKSHAVADDIARELAEALDEMTEHVCPPHVLNTLKRYEQVMGNE